MNIKRLNEELTRLLEEDNVKIGEYTVIPHGETATNLYKKAIEYLKSNPDKLKSGFINIPLSSLGVDDMNKDKKAGYQLKKQ